MSFLSHKKSKKYEKMAKNGQKMAEIKNPFKFLLLTHFALYMPKIICFGQKTKKCYHNCPTQQYNTGPLLIVVWGFEKCNNFSICRQIKISQKYFYPQTYLPTRTFDLVSNRKWGIRSYSALLDSLKIEDPTSSYRIPCQVPLLAHQT